MIDLAAFSTAIGLAKQAMDLCRGLKDLHPDEARKRTIEQTLQQAEQQFKIAEAQAARELLYVICRCTWPPQIAISQGANPIDPYGEIFKCPSCKREFRDSSDSVTMGG
jgi:hypothetical protein